MAWWPDTEGRTQRTSLTPKTTPLDLVPQDQPVPEGDNDLSNEYCEETDTCHPLADLLEQFQQLKNQFASLKSNTPQSTPTELSQLTDKLQHVTMALQPVLESCEEPVHETMQAYTCTLCTTQRESNLTTTMLQDIPTFDGQDFKFGRLVHGYRDCCWYPIRNPHMPAWGQIMWPQPHTHLWGSPQTG